MPILASLQKTYETIEKQERQNQILYSNRFSHIYIYEEITNLTVTRVKKEVEIYTRAIINLTNDPAVDIIYTLPKPIIIHLNSPGGDTNSGIALSNVVLSAEVPLIVIAEGVVASAATFILVKARLSYILDNAFILIHQYFGTLSGKREELVFNLEVGNHFMNFLIELYKDNTKLSTPRIKDMLTHDIYMSSGEAIKYGLVNHKIFEDI